jgi:hypothetical protein
MKMRLISGGRIAYGHFYRKKKGKTGKRGMNYMKTNCRQRRARKVAKSEALYNETTQWIRMMIEATQTGSTCYVRDLPGGIPHLVIPERPEAPS